jgi:hypothetical protein
MAERLFVSEAAGRTRLQGMDFDPCDDELFELDQEPSGTSGAPDFRVTVQSTGAVRLVYWGPWLQCTGPAYTLIAGRERAGVAIADLRVVRDDVGLAAELIVQFHAGGGEAHRRALRDWASRAGYRRAWFDGEVVELEPAGGGLVRTRCTGCGQRFIDGAAAGSGTTSVAPARSRSPARCADRTCRSGLASTTTNRRRRRGRFAGAPRHPGPASARSGDEAVEVGCRLDRKTWSEGSVGTRRVSTQQRGEPDAVREVTEHARPGCI